MNSLADRLLALAEEMDAVSEMLSGVSVEGVEHAEELAGAAAVVRNWGELIG